MKDDRGLDDLFDDFTPPESIEEEELKVAHRCAFFLRNFNEYDKRIKKIGLTKATLNKRLLVNAVQSYFLDISRVKQFHGMHTADRFKIAGYTLKWLSKIKPIQHPDVDSSSPNSDKRLILLNEDFALANAFVICGINYKNVPVKFVLDVLYTLHYRAVDAGILAHLMEMASRTWQGKPLELGNRP